jgi:hypothetical protein
MTHCAFVIEKTRISPVAFAKPSSSGGDPIPEPAT